MIEEIQIALAFMFYFLKGEWFNIFMIVVSIIELNYIIWRDYE